MASINNFSSTQDQGRLIQFHGSHLNIRKEYYSSIWEKWDFIIRVEKEGRRNELGIWELLKFIIFFNEIPEFICVCVCVCVCVCDCKSDGEKFTLCRNSSAPNLDRNILLSGNDYLTGGKLANVAIL